MLTEILICAASFGTGTLVPRFKRKPKPEPLNIIYGLLLPHPADERWEIKIETTGCLGTSCFSTKHTYYALDKISIYGKCNSYCATIKIDNTNVCTDGPMPKEIYEKTQLYYDAIKFEKQQLITLALV